MSRFEAKVFNDLEQLMANLWIMKQAAAIFDSCLVERLIRRLQFEHFGNENADYRLHCENATKSNFILWVLSLIKDTRHWELGEFIFDGAELLKRALFEIGQF